MAELVLGPLLRYVGETEATVWVETDEPCEVEILGRGRAHLHGRRAPLRAGPARRPRAGRQLRVRGSARRRAPLAAGRIGAAAEPDPHARREQAARRLLRLLPRRPPSRGALHGEQGPATKTARSTTRSGSSPARWPAASTASGPSSLFLLGDQVYVDEGSPRTREQIRERARHRHPAGRGGHRLRGVHLALPGELERAADPLAALDRLGLDALGRPRHERRLEHLRAPGSRRCAESRGGTAARSPASPATGSTSTSATSPRAALDEDDLYRRVRGNQHATAELCEWARRSTPPPSGTRWSFCRDLGGTRAIFVDSRAGRVLDDGNGARSSTTTSGTGSSSRRG